MANEAASYLMGRESATLPPQASAPASEDKLFAAQRIDGQQLEEQRFYHCTFANISFKDATLRGCEFLDCAFLNCYFRKAVLVNTTFVGSKFYDCDFPKVSIQSCDFRYAKFRTCFIPKSEIEHSLPGEPNLRGEIANDLAQAADDLGQVGEARAYRLVAIAARQEDLSCAVRGSSSWYKDHYRGVARIGPAVRLLGSKINGYLWGHGEKVGVLLLNLAVLTFVLFPLLLLCFRDGLTSSSGAPTIPQLLWLSITTMLPMSGQGTVLAVHWGARIVLAVETLLGLVIAGLLVTLLFRRVVRR